MTSTEFLIVDLFCGAGGTTLGFEKTNGLAKVIACVNHDPKAIKSHWLNHPEIHHFEEDIRTLELSPLVDLVMRERSKYPFAKLILWASLECTNFSKAKGGKPRDADSRTLADHLHRYITALNPDIIQIENVVEFMSWGPLDENGKPISRKNGSDWMRWRSEICTHGYVDEWKELNSADFGAHTSRNRLFGIFAKNSTHFAWPEPTHTKNPVKSNMFASLEKWKAVKEVLNFSDEGESIFNRKKPLSDKTLQRILAGLIKYVANGETSFISKYYSGRPAGKVNSVNVPSSTITTFGAATLVQPISILKYNSTDKNGKHNPPSIEELCPVIAVQNRLGIINAEFLTHYYGSGGQYSSIENPCPVVTTKARTAKVHVAGYSQNQSINNPAGTVMGVDKHRLVKTTPFLMPTSYDNKPKSIEEPAPTLQASRRHHYIVNPSHGGHSTSIDNPCPVIIARQDKAPLYLLSAEPGQYSVPVYDEDSEAMVYIKEFMAAYGIVDIKMRMLRVIELLRIQGFPADYKLFGNQSDQKKFIGNSVVPIVVAHWLTAMSTKQKLAA